MKKVLKVFYIILLIVLLKLIFSFVINEIYISKYEKGKYNESLVKILNAVNFPESYVAPYNYGNLFYQKGKYADAIDEYNIALASNPPKEKECSIRINKALCILASVDLENKTPEENIEILYNAREVLCENGCANENDSGGHSKTAEQLKKEIDELIEKLKEEQESSDEDKDDEEEKKDDEEQEDDEKDEEEEQKKEEELKERNQDAREEREDLQEGFGELDQSDDTYTTGHQGKNW